MAIYGFIISLSRPVFGKCGYYLCGPPMEVMPGIGILHRWAPEVLFSAEKCTSTVQLVSSGFTRGPSNAFWRL